MHVTKACIWKTDQEKNTFHKKNLTILENISAFLCTCKAMLCFDRSLRSCIGLPYLHWWNNDIPQIDGTLSSVLAKCYLQEEKGNSSHNSTQSICYEKSTWNICI